MKQRSIFKGTDAWKMADVWNAALVNQKERKTEPRDRIWASELGKPNIELFLKMKGVPSTNPPSERAKRKFEAGHLFEWIVQVILQRGGILQSTQDYVTHQFKDCVNVTGKLDFLAGGVPDYKRWDEWEGLMKALDMPDVFFRTNEALREHFGKKYPEGLAETILEIKSCSVFSMNAMEKTGRSSRNHRLQDMHYLISMNKPLGRVVYICRDDLRMFEVPVKLNDRAMYDEYRNAVEEISRYFYAHVKTPLESIVVMEEGRPIAFNAELDGLPPLEKPVVWDADYQKFARNWGVEYSSYLTLLYGYTDQKMFEDATVPIVSRWNRVLGRMKKQRDRLQWLAEHGAMESDVQKEKITVAGKTRMKTVQFVVSKHSATKDYIPENLLSGHDMTSKNLEVIEEIKREGYMVEDLIAQYAGDGEEEEEV